MGLCPSAPAVTEDGEASCTKLELKPWQDPANANLAEKYLGNGRVPSACIATPSLLFAGTLVIEQRSEPRPEQDDSRLLPAEHQASLRTQERQRQLLNARLQADSSATRGASRRGGRSSTVRSMAGRSDADDATRGQHEALGQYARNSSLSRGSTMSLATASHSTVQRPVSAEAAAARVRFQASLACCIHLLHGRPVGSGDAASAPLDFTSACAT